MKKNVSMLRVMKEAMFKPKNTVPPGPLPSVRTDLGALPAKGAAIVWFGHSSYLIKVNGYTILVDPVFSGHASPLPWMVKAFAGTNEYTVKDMPAIDMVLLTHDHYDHLDYATIKALRSSVKLFCTSLGVGSHLKYWGVDPAKIMEFDWLDVRDIAPGIQLIATPARHFSGRGLRRGLTLWSSFVLKIHGYSLFIGGDSGYEQHFQMIGDMYGPFDIAMLENGQYNTYWPYIHMMPEEMIQAAIDLKAKLVLPVHWAKFSLALHPWDEPIRRALAAAEKAGVPLTTPKIGEPVVLGGSLPHSTWWNIS